MARQKILVIEDEPSIADNIIYALSAEGYGTVCAGTGREAIGLLGPGDVDFIILDVGLPDMSGLDLLREIRRSSSVPVIIVSARGEEIDKVVGLELGADDYVSKPFSPRELTARVRSVLRRIGGKGPEGRTGGGDGRFRVDEDRRTIEYMGTALDLTRYEYLLLLHLVRGPGKVYTREVLMDLIWEDPGMSTDRTVDTHIKTIRQKLRAVSPEHDPIVTHRGVGYSLRDDG